MTDLAIQLVPALLWTVAFAIPQFFILKRAGKSPWFLLIAIVPMLGAVALLWYVAFARWPALDRQAAAAHF